MSANPVVAFERTPSSLPMELTRIESALAMATTAPEVNQVIALMDAAVAYAKRFYKDQADVIQRAKALRLQAELRLGQMLREMPKATGGDAQRTRFAKGTESPHTIAELGIDKKTSMRAQRLAAMPAAKFAEVVSGKVAISEVMAPMKRAAPSRVSKANQKRIEEIDAAKARGISMLCTYVRLTLTALRSQSTFTDEERTLIDELADAIQQVGELQG